MWLLKNCPAYKLTRLLVSKKLISILSKTILFKKPEFIESTSRLKHKHFIKSIIII